jgi:hypothetical protein
VRSLLDTDFYKLLMLQMIRHIHPEVRATFSSSTAAGMCALARSSMRANCARNSITPARCAFPRRS